MTKKTKAEKEAEAQAKQAVLVRAALRWTEQAPPPDVMPPADRDPFGTLSTGWTFNVYAQRVMEACSSRTGHALGRTDQTNSQRPLSLYSTRLLALRALRNAMEQEFAEKLAKIDKEIEGEKDHAIQ